MFEPHLVNDQHLVLSVSVLLTTEGNVATSVFWVDLPNSIAVLMMGPADVDWVVLFIEPTLNCSSRNVTITGVHPGQVAVAWSHKDVIIFFSNLLSTIANVASVV